jgi:hypothetical protein
MMKTTTFAALAVIVAGTIALAAQGASSSQAQAPITVTGCIQKAESPAAAAAPAAGEQKGAGFVLANARPGKADEAVGTSGSASSTKYPLDADASKLDPHVGHKVEISGTFQPNTTGAPPTMKVESVKMVGASCEDAAKEAPKAAPTPAPTEAPRTAPRGE